MVHQTKTNNTADVSIQKVSNIAVVITFKLPVSPNEYFRSEIEMSINKVDFLPVNYISIPTWRNFSQNVKLQLANPDCG